MSRFRELSHAIWHCQYHVVWTPKYRYRILAGQVREEVTNCIHSFSEQLRCEVVELNVQSDHVHLLVMIPPKVSVSDYVGTVKGRTAIRVFSRFRHLKRTPYWGNHFWTKGNCADTVGLDSEMIRALRQVSGKARASAGTGETGLLSCDGTAQPCLLWGQGRFIPFQGLYQGHPLRGWMLYACRACWLIWRVEVPLPTWWR